MARRFTPPGARHDADDEGIDYRFTLANERTFLSWVRTALALDAAGLAVIQLLPELPVPHSREAIGVGLVALGTVIASASLRRWLAVERAMRRQERIPASWLPSVLAGTVGVLSLAAVVLLAWGQLR